MDWIPRFVYGIEPEDWSPSVPQRPWSRSTPTVGGSRTSAAGIPASHVVRRDRLLTMRLRVYEYEWADVEALVAWGQYSEPITVYLDREDVVGVDCYLESPLAGEALEPQREDGFPLLLGVDLTWRRVDGQVWTREYFPI
jgi:hypothetical protein